MMMRCYLISAMISAFDSAFVFQGSKLYYYLPGDIERFVWNINKCPIYLVYFCFVIRSIPLFLNFQVLLLIGENIENSDIVCGVVVNVRAKCKLCKYLLYFVLSLVSIFFISYCMTSILFTGVWLSDSSNQKAIIEVGKQLRQIGTGKISFQQHDSITNLCTL